jgi:electron transport complex protein RnfE
MRPLQLLKRGILHENPIFVQILALCPLLAVTTSAVNAVSMGMATTAVMVGACCCISLIRRWVPNEIRIAVCVVVIAGFVTMVHLLMQAFLPPVINESLGIYVPLIVVNCVLFARVESFAMKNSLGQTFFDAIGMGLGFTLGMLVIGIIREFLGSGSIFGIVFLPNPTSNMLVMVLAPGAFFTLGTLLMVMNYLQQKKKSKGSGS